jgi:D-alanyl-D-alanine carboxypeptidase/D-alanyl-D-alanine-endopeptidase (penicillin-binding protein 4)
MMMNRKIYVFALALLAVPLMLLAQTDSVVSDAVELSWGQRFCQRVDSVVQIAENDHYFTGVSIYDLTADSLLYAHNADKLMRPASTQKILTAVAALDVLGAAHKYETKAYYTGGISLSDSVLHGDIYIVGDFDPAYSSADLRLLATYIKGLGINHINGRIIGDVSMKDTLTMGNGWCWDDVPSPVEAYLSPLIFNRGCASVEIENGKAVFSVPTTYMTLSDSTRQRSGSLRITRNWVDNGNDFVVYGSPTKNAVSNSVSVYRPERYFVCTLADMLRAEGVTFSNAPSESYDIGMLEDATLVPFYICSRTVEQILQQMMKDSDNLYAESMFYQLANFKAGKWASWKDGAAVVDSVMRKIGIPANQCKVADGSGVSLYNYTTPSAQVAALRYAYGNDHIYRHLYPSLPIAGRDGTLERRMRKTSAEMNVRAKTGTVTGVSCLAGYCRASNGNLLAFSIINSGLYRGATGRDFQDRLCKVMTE